MDTETEEDTILQEQTNLINEDMKTDDEDVQSTSVKISFPPLRSPNYDVRHTCEHCRAKHQGNFALCRACGAILDVDLYNHRREEWEEIDVITSKILREKLDGHDSWTRILVGFGKLHFLRASQELVTVKNASQRLLFEGTPEQVEDFLAGRLKPIVERIQAQKSTVPKAKVPKSPKATEASKQGRGRGTSYRADVYGHPVTGIIRWMGKDGFTFIQIKTALASLLETPPQDTTITIQRSWGLQDKKPTPLLTEEQASELRRFKV